MSNTADENQALSWPPISGDYVTKNGDLVMVSTNSSGRVIAWWRGDWRTLNSDWVIDYAPPVKIVGVKTSEPTEAEMALAILTGAMTEKFGIGTCWIIDDAGNGHGVQCWNLAEEKNVRARTIPALYAAMREAGMIGEGGE